MAEKVVRVVVVVMVVMVVLAVAVAEVEMENAPRNRPMGSAGLASETEHLGLARLFGWQRNQLPGTGSSASLAMDRICRCSG